MARYIALGIWTFIGTAILFVIVSTAHGFDSNGQSLFNSEEEVANRHSALGVRNSRRRAGGAIKYKKVSVMQSGMETPDVFEVADMGQNKTRRLKTKTSHRHTMIYKPTKKRTSQSKKNSFASSVSTTRTPEVKVEELADSSRRTKTWHQVQPVTEIIDSFIRPTKRNRLRVNSRQQTSTHGPTTTTLTPKITKDPLRPISRVRSGSITTTTSKSTTSKFLRLDRKPYRWQSNASNERTTKETNSESSVTSTTESTTIIPEILTHSSKKVFQVNPEIVPDSHESSERPEIEHVKEESSIRKVAAKPDKIAYFDTNDPAANIHSGTRSSQEKNARPRIHVPKKETHHEIQRPSQEPILLQTKEQREQQQLEASDKRKAEESAQLQTTRQRTAQSESNAQPQSETDEETERRHEKYEAEKSKQLERLRQTNIAGATQFEVDLPKARRIPSRTDYSNSAVQHSADTVKLKVESTDSGRFPAYGQRLPSSGHNSFPSADPRPSYSEFEASYPSPGHKPEQQRYTDSPSSHSDIRPDRVRHRYPNVATPRPDSDEDSRSIYKTTPPPIYGEEKYKRPELIYTPPEKEYQPPSAYLTMGHGTYPRLRIAYQPASSSIPPPPVTYEPPHLEYMPPAASPPPRIYVPPVEDYKPPSTTAVVLHGHRQEEETPPARHPPARLEASRMNEDLRKLEEINTYTRLVSVGHPSVKELPYPPQRNAPTVSSRPAQPIEPAITENPYTRTYERLQSSRDKGETLQEQPPREYFQSTAPKLHVVEGTFIVDNTGTQMNERARPSYAGSSLIVGKPYYQKEEVPAKINPYLSYRPSYDTEVTQKPYAPHSVGDVNSGRRYPDSALPAGQHIHQSTPHYKPYQTNEPNSAYQQQVSEPFRPKEPRQLQQPATEKPYIISWPGGRDDLEVADYRHKNVIPVSEQPPYKPCDLPEVAALRLEKPLKEIPYYVVSEKPITVTVRPYGLATAESERNENIYRPPGRNNQPKSLSSEPSTTNVGNYQNQQVIDKDLQDGRDALEQRPQHQSEQQLNIPASFLPVGPVRAYQVTQAIYPSPPPRFLQYPAPLPNPFENQFTSPATPLPTPPPPPQSSSTTSDSFGSQHLPSGDTWSVNPLFPNQQQFPSSRPFASSVQFQSPEEPVSSERIVRYRPASTYRENHRLNRSLTHYSIQQRPLDERFREAVGQKDVEDETYHQTRHDYNVPELRDTSYQQQNGSYNHRDNPSYLQAPPGYEGPAIQNGRIHQSQEDPTDRDSSPEGDFSGVKGIPGVDYPILHAIPNDLKFKCELVDSADTHHPAYYADPYTRCQVFHVCQASRAKNSFLCPNGTIFNQKVRVCDWWHNVQCDESSAYYNVNDNNDSYQFKH